MVSVSIITPTIDSSTYIDEAILSVPRLELDEVEHIIVHDGASEFLQRLASLYPWLRLLQGPARGATAACAMAIAQARNAFIFPLMSDDRMVAGALRKLGEKAAARPEIEVWTGGIRIFHKNSSGSEETIRTIGDPTHTALTLSNVLDDLPLMNARFVHRTVYERVGLWDERFSASSDREFAIRLVLAKVREAALGAPVAELRQHPESQTIRPPGKFLPPYLAEHIELARQWTTVPKLSRRTKAAFRNWYGREVLRAAYYAIRCRKFATAEAFIRSAFAADPIWPLRSLSLFSAMRLRRR